MKSIADVRSVCVVWNIGTAPFVDDGNSAESKKGITKFARCRFASTSRVLTLHNRNIGFALCIDILRSSEQRSSSSMCFSHIVKRSSMWR